MLIIWVNTTALNITFVPADTRADVEFYKARYQDKICDVNPKATPLYCILSGLVGGTQYRIQGMACTSKTDCSSVLIKDGYTLPDGKLRFFRLFC